MNGSPGTYTAQDPPFPTGDQLARALEARHVGNHWMARCPAHGAGGGDSSPSLSISDGRTGAAVFKCFAGCDQDAVLEALREIGAWPPVPEPESMPARAKGQTKRRIIATYGYLNTDSTLVCQAVRYDPKDFRQRRPDGKGGWVWNMHGVTPPLYRLPELMAADPDDTVYICEGEKDVDRLRRLGLVATTNIGGAGKWRPEYSRQLQGQRVVILPDNDPAGETHAAAVAQSLDGIAAEVRVVRLPGLKPKGDVSNWLDVGGTAPELEALVEATSPKTATPSKDCLSRISGSQRDIWQSMGGIRACDVVPRPVSWVWDSRLAKGKVSMLDGDPGLGKSTIWVDLVARITTHQAMPDGSANPLGGPASVLVLAAEDGDDDTIVPRLMAAGADMSRVVLLKEYPAEDGQPARPLVFPDDTAHLETCIAAAEAVLVVIDPLIAYLSAELKSNSDQDVRRMLSFLVPVIERQGCALLALRHLNKTPGANPLYRGGGSIGFIAAARVGLVVGKDPDDETGQRRILAVSKCNIAAEAPSLAYRMQGVAFPADEHDGLILHTARIVWDGTSQTSAARLIGAAPPGADGGVRAGAMELIQGALDGGPCKEVEVRKEVTGQGVSERTYFRARRDLKVQAQKEPVFGKGEWWLRLDDSTPWPWEPGGAGVPPKTATDTDAPPAADPPPAAPLAAPPLTAKNPLTANENGMAPNGSVSHTGACSVADCPHPAIVDPTGEYGADVDFCAEHFQEWLHAQRPVDAPATNGHAAQRPPPGTLCELCEAAGGDTLATTIGPDGRALCGADFLAEYAVETETVTP